MSKEKTTKKVCKAIFSYHKELRWLEEMAKQGWFLKNMTLGMIYTFEKGEPKHMVYDMDRFNLPKKPTLEEIRRKEMFMEMADALGWTEVTHSEDLTYYFAKEYEEGGINHLHNDEQSRVYRAESFKNYLLGQAKVLVYWGMVIAFMDVFVRITQIPDQRMDFLNWYHWFSSIYVIYCNGFALWAWRQSVKRGKELEMTREEWEASVDPATHKTVRKLIWTNRGLNKFLAKMTEQGWTLTGLTATKYFFEKSESENLIYTLDSKYLVNKRRMAMKQEKITDGKDWIGLNNDWEIESVKDAESLGWTFVCALENRGIIYKGEAGEAQPLNDAKYDRSLRWISLIGEYGFYLLLCGCVGGIIGFIMGMMNL